MTPEERKILDNFAWEIVLHKKIKGFHIDDNYQPFTVGYADDHLAIDFHQPYNMKNRKGGYYTIELKLRTNKENKSAYEVDMSVIGVDVQQRLKQLIKENEELKVKLEDLQKEFSYSVELNGILNAENNKFQKEKNEIKYALQEEKKLNEYFKSRFVICNTCTDDMKQKCPMYKEQFCNGERCNEIVDLVSLLDKAADKGEIQ